MTARLGSRRNLIAAIAAAALAAVYLTAFLAVSVWLANPRRFPVPDYYGSPQWRVEDRALLSDELRRFHGERGYVVFECAGTTYIVVGISDEYLY